MAYNDAGDGKLTPKNSRVKLGGVGTTETETRSSGNILDTDDTQTITSVTRSFLSSNNNVKSDVNGDNSQDNINIAKLGDQIKAETTQTSTSHELENREVDPSESDANPKSETAGKSQDLRRKEEDIEVDEPEEHGGASGSGEADNDENLEAPMQAASVNDYLTVEYSKGDFGTGSDTDRCDSDSSGGKKQKKNMGSMFGKQKGAKADHSMSTSSDDDTETSWRESTKTKQKNWNLRPSTLQRAGLGHLKRQWSDRDTQMYRAGYPGKRDNPNEDLNLKFYQGRLRSRPDGAYIQDFHDIWWHDHDRLESRHGFIQWLFPIRESGMNWEAQELQLHEAKAIQKDKTAFENFLKSYEMMLYFYGIKLVDRETGEVERADNCRERFRHLNYSMHNYLRITRILKCLGELGLERYKPPLLRLMLHEAIVTGELGRTLDSCYNYWIGTLRDDKTQKRIRDLADRLYREKQQEEQGGAGGGGGGRGDKKKKKGKEGGGGGKGSQDEKRKKTGKELTGSDSAVAGRWGEEEEEEEEEGERKTVPPSRKTRGDREEDRMEEEEEGGVAGKRSKDRGAARKATGVEDASEEEGESRRQIAAKEKKKTPPKAKGGQRKMDEFVKR